MCLFSFRKSEEDMKLVKRKAVQPQEEVITIIYSEWNNRLEDIKNYILSSDKHITGFGRNKEMIQIRIEDILYFEAVGEYVFAYLEKEVYEVKLRLYQLEEDLEEYKMKRASKSVLVNVKKIIAVRPALNGRLFAKMENDEEILISRQYAKSITAEIMAD